MSKTVKKKSRRMWRTVRKTLGTLFLVSALVIAAIPVDGRLMGRVQGVMETEEIINIHGFRSARSRVSKILREEIRRYMWIGIRTLSLSMVRLRTTGMLS